MCLVSVLCACYYAIVHLPHLRMVLFCLGCFRFTHNLAVLLANSPYIYSTSASLARLSTPTAFCFAPRHISSSSSPKNVSQNWAAVPAGFLGVRVCQCDQLVDSIACIVAIGGPTNGDRRIAHTMQHSPQESSRNVERPSALPISTNTRPFPRCLLKPPPIISSTCFSTGFSSSMLRIQHRSPRFRVLNKNKGAIRTQTRGRTAPVQVYNSM